TESEAKSITQADKNPERILEARLGIENEEPVWEVTYKNANNTIGYYLISAISGKWLKDIENI
ncbi:MAG: PepSY domain-containing protein, partial [Trichococcus sp.]